MSEHDSGDGDVAAGIGRASRSPWWWLALVVVAAIAVGVTHPWVSDRPGPETALASGTAAIASPASPSPAHTRTAAPRPVRAAVFDQSTLALLFATPADLAASVPAADAGMSAGITSGQVSWGLPTGSTVEPAGCTIASTVVDAPPTGFDERSWWNATLDFEQHVTLLPDVASADAAFRGLVTSVDACPSYVVISPDAAPTTISAAPATEAQGVFPSLAQSTESTSGGQVVPQLHGHVLVGNAIITWTASARTSDGSAPDRTGLGTQTELDAMFQRVALRAVTSLR